MSKAKDKAGLRVLVVEDEGLMRRFLHKILEEAGYSVIEAKTAVGALEQSRSAERDLILMDYVLRDMNGLQLLEAIRSQTPLAGVPIICLTGKSDIPTKMEALENGAVDYVTKPFDRRELLARISRHIQLKDQIKETETRFAQAAQQDPLTGLGNRKRFSPRLSSTFDPPHRTGPDPLTFLSFD